MDQNQNYSQFQNYQPEPENEAPFLTVKKARHFREKARASLCGKFKAASLAEALFFLTLFAAVGFPASVMAGLAYFLDLISVVSDTSAISAVLPFVTLGLLFSGVFFLCAPLYVGYSRMNLEILDGEEVKTETLFGSFKKGYWTTVKLFLLCFLLIFAISLPIIIVSMVPFIILAALDVSLGLGLAGFLLGYVAAIAAITAFAYRYAMVFLILAEYPEMSAVDAMRASVSMMRGRKRRFFCLQCSFLGWILLLLLVGICTCGIGFLIGIHPLTVYMTMSTAAFYDDAANRAAAREAARDVVFPSLDLDDYNDSTQATPEHYNPNTTGQ